MSNIGIAANETLYLFISRGHAKNMYCIMRERPGVFGDELRKT